MIRVTSSVCTCVVYVIGCRLSITFGRAGISICLVDVTAEFSGYQLFCTATMKRVLSIGDIVSSLMDDNTVVLLTTPMPIYRLQSVTHSAQSIHSVYHGTCFSECHFCTTQGSAVSEKPAPRAASRRTCCKQTRWTLSVINLRTN